MTEEDDIPSGAPEDDVLAAELALGALAFEERAQALARAEWDPAFAARVSAWEETLAPMAQETAAVPPPPSARRRLMRELFGEGEAGEGAGAPGRPRALPDRPAEARPMRRVSAIWQVAAMAAAIAIGAFVYDPSLVPGQGPAETRYVAVIAAADSDLRFFAVLDEKTGEAVVRRISGAAPEGMVHQMWMANEGAPVSMGLLDEERAELRMPAELLAPGGGFLPGAHFGVSVEPPGGSPTGQPSAAPVAGGAPEAL